MKLSDCASGPFLSSVSALLRDAISLVIAVLMLVARAYIARLVALGKV